MRTNRNNFESQKCAYSILPCYYGFFFLVEISITLSKSTTYFPFSKFWTLFFVGGGVCFFGLVQPELPWLPSSSFCQLESRNLHILTCSIFWNLDDVVRPSVWVVHGNCKLEITPFFSFQCQFSSYLGRSSFGQAISDYVFFLVPHPSPTSTLSCYPWPKSYLV